MVVKIISPIAHELAIAINTGVILPCASIAASPPIPAPRANTNVVARDAALPACSSKKVMYRPEAAGMMEPVIQITISIKPPTNMGVADPLKLNATKALRQIN